MIYELYLSYILIIPNTVAEHVTKLIEKFMLSIVTGYTGIVLLGFLIRHHYRDLLKKRKQIGRCIFRSSIICIDTCAVHI